MKRIIVTAIAFLTFLRVATPAVLFPEIKGWELKETEKVYGPSDLWEIIDGAAEGFIGYGFIGLHIAEYNIGDQIVRVELYDQGSKENAYGIYSSERMPDYPPVNVGAQGYKSEGIVNYFTGHYYVKTMAVGLTEVSDESVLFIAQQVDDNLALSHEMPEVPGLFPEEGMEKLSDTFISSDFMGYGFLHSAYTARYNVTGSEFQLFIISVTPDEAGKMIERYKTVLGGDKVEQKGLFYIFNDRFNGTVFIAGKDGYLVGARNTDDEQLALKYIQLVLNKLQ